jgi:hypothetical protein
MRFPINSKQNTTYTSPRLMNSRWDIITFGLMITILIFTFLPAQDTLITDFEGKQVPDFLLKNISVDFENILLDDALTNYAIETKFYLNYNENIIPPNHLISVKLNDVPAIIVLQKLLEGTGINFMLSKSGQIVLVGSQKRTRSKNCTISGFISDAETGEALIGTNIYIEALHAGCTSNVYGFYSLTVPSGHYPFIYSYIGYETKRVDIQLNQNIKQNVELIPNAFSGDTIVVTANAEENIIKSTEIGTIKLTPKNLSDIPAFLGEQDILKTLHLLPGVTMVREGDSGFNVRGGNSDQNLVLLDEAPVYNAFHFFGFFSVFNSDAIKNVKLIKGPAPPKYGGKLSSVLDIQMNEGNLKEFQGNGGIGTIFSRLTLEGPIKKGISSYIVSARRTYADVFTHLFGNNEVKNSSLYFYDFNLKTNYRLSEIDRLFMSGYFGQDVLGYSGIFRNSWGNKTATIRWNHIFSDKLFLNSSAIDSNFKYGVKVEPEEDSQDDETIELENNINAFTLAEDFQYFLNAENTLNFGLQYVFYNFLPGKLTVTGDSPFNLTAGKRKARSISFYAAHEFAASTRMKINYGLRYSYFPANRVKDTYDFSQINDPPLIEFQGNEQITYRGAEPRITVNYKLNEQSSVKFGYARNYQYIHQISNSTSGTPLDVWQPSNSNIRPQRSDQVSLGYFRNLANNSWELSIETFYKEMQHLVDFKNGANIFFSTFFGSDLVFGNGKSYGIEFLLKKNLGKLTGWVGYSLAKSDRKFNEINQGKPFPPKFDRTHDFSIVSMYKINTRWTFAATWVYYTGNAVTIPYGKYQIAGQVLEAYSDRNAYRLPAYHRLDINFTYTTRKGHTWNLSIYNAYGRRNTYAILFRDDEPDPLRLALFSFVPSISYNFKF